MLKSNQGEISNPFLNSFQILKSVWFVDQQTNQYYKQYFDKLYSYF